MAQAGTVIPALNERPIKNTICLFDVDDTLSRPRRAASTSMLQLLSALRHKVAIGFVGGSNLVKQQEQLGTSAIDVTSLFDFCFPENGLVAYRMGEALATQSFIGWLGEEKWKRFVNFCLRFIADCDEIPIKRGTFVEFRNGMVNVSPIGRNATVEERNQFNAFDKEAGVRKRMVEALKKEFPDYGLTYAIGGQISFDVFPHGWDKTYCLNHLQADKERPDGVDFKTIHFFGDKTMEGGNDYEIYTDPRTIGHSVTGPDDTEKQLRELFDL
ncbi:MAG: Phosphomannomutase [Bathelium mastoideum]|nr:MAG: Phosphomannomutase [Bathelium mastoideum]